MAEIELEPLREDQNASSKQVSEVLLISQISRSHRDSRHRCCFSEERPLAIYLTIYSLEALDRSVSSSEQNRRELLRSCELHLLVHSKSERISVAGLHSHNRSFAAGES